MLDCPSIPDGFEFCEVPDNTTCGPCDYASQSACGTPSRQNLWGNCTCPFADLYCNAAADPDWNWLPLNAKGNSSYTRTLGELDVHAYRLFVDEGAPHCNISLLFRLLVIYGEPDIYVGEPTFGAGPLSITASYASLPWRSRARAGDFVQV